MSGDSVSANARTKNRRVQDLELANTKLQKELGIVKKALSSSQSLRNENTSSTTKKIAELENKIASLTDSNGALQQEIDALTDDTTTLQQLAKNVKHQLQQSKEETASEKKNIMLLYEELSELKKASDTELETIKKDLSDCQATKAIERQLRLKAEKDISRVREERTTDIEKALVEERKKSGITLDNIRASNEKEFAKVREEHNLELASLQKRIIELELVLEAVEGAEGETNNRKNDAASPPAGDIVKDEPSDADRIDIDKVKKERDRWERVARDGAKKYQDMKKELYDLEGICKGLKDQNQQVSLAFRTSKDMVNDLIDKAVSAATDPKDIKIDALEKQIATLKDASLARDTYITELETQIRESKAANTVTTNTDLGFAVAESTNLGQENDSSEARFKALEEQMRDMVEWRKRTFK